MLTRRPVPVVVLFSAAVAVLVALACVAAPARGPSSRPPQVVVSNTVEALGRGPLELRVRDADGAVVASARVAADGSTELVVGELEAIQVGEDLRLSVGTVPGMPRFDRRALLHPLLARRATTSDGLVVLEGEPPTRLVGGRFEIDLGGGGTLVVGPGLR